MDSSLATRRGKLTLALLCAVAFLDFVDASIVNVALPSIRHHLHFSVQSLQWVLSGYLLTYGGLLVPAFRILDGERPARRKGGFDMLGAILATGGMLLLAYSLIKAPDVGWGTARTIGGVGGALALLAGFVAYERRHPDPLFPLSI